VPPVPLRGQGPVLAAVAAGGVLGALARWAVGLALPRAADGFPWDVLAVNALGGLLIGALAAEVTQRRRAQPLLGPFLVTGVLGGFTTFSTSVVDAQGLLAAGRVATAAAALAGTLLAAVAATWLGLALARAVRR
jgi:fluoride exporter